MKKLPFKLLVEDARSEVPKLSVGEPGALAGSTWELQELGFCKRSLFHLASTREPRGFGAAAPSRRQRTRARLCPAVAQPWLALGPGGLLPQAAHGAVQLCSRCSPWRSCIAELLAGERNRSFLAASHRKQASFGS